MSDARPQPLMGRLAVHLKMITLDQLAEVTREQGRNPESAKIGDLLVSMGLITPEQLAQLVRTQKGIVAKHRAKQRAASAVPASAPPLAAPAAVASAPPPRVASPPAPARDATSGDTSALDALLREAVDRGASDLHLHGGAPVRARIAGALVELPDGPADSAQNERVVLASLSADDRARFEDRGEIDFCYALGDEARFRVNVYRQQRGVDAVFRVILPRPPTLEALGLPSSLARYINFHQGMVLVAGPSGSGKTSTLASLVNLINEERREHIITVEEPIEYVHPAKRCLVNQRSVGPHTESFSRALRAALREDPDVIVIGELRDLETISLALTAAETGHLVLATLHTDNAIRTINRVIGAYPSDQQDQVRTMLSESLRAVICQRLVPRSDGNGRVAALETLSITRAVGNLIRENKTFQIQSVLQTGTAQGMLSMDSSLRDLVKTGVVAREVALRHCENPRVLGG
jgi:twitching motility protein PilT